MRSSLATGTFRAKTRQDSRAALIAEKVAMGMDTKVAEAAVRRDEAKRLEQRTADAAPMEV